MLKWINFIYFQIKENVRVELSKRDIPEAQSSIFAETTSFYLMIINFIIIHLNNIFFI